MIDFAGVTKEEGHSVDFLGSSHTGLLAKHTIHSLHSVVTWPPLEYLWDQQLQFQLFMNVSFLSTESKLMLFSGNGIPNWLAAGRFQLKCKQTPPLVPRLDFFGSQPPERLTLTHWEARQDEEHFCRPGTNLKLIAKLHFTDEETED